MTTEQELMEIIDEIAAAAANMNQGSQHYDNFIRSRERCKQRLDQFFKRDQAIMNAIDNLCKLAS